MRTCSILAGLLLAPGVAGAGDRVDYARDIKPILAEKCHACHGAWKQKGKLRLETVALVRKGGRSGPVVVPGKPAESVLIARVSGAGGETRMPPPGEGEALTPEQLALVRKWIEQGADGPDEPTPPDPREHWAFKPPVRPAVPDAGNPIDALLAAGWRRRGLAPEPPADGHVLLRRVYLDLIGLPPTREELHAFLTDDAPDAYEKVVDRLLASPRYGERWGRHWMDVWRYSDWSGENNNQVRGSPKHVWRWRDWIVESLNADKGYDRMVAEMLAGDEIAPNDPATLRATGFLARNYYKFNRNVWLDDTVEHTAKAFLGLTVGCARCHDHKFDPIAQADYYRLRAVFEPHQVRTDRVGGQPDLQKDGLVRVFDKDPAAPTFLFHRGDEAQPEKDHPLAPGVPEIFGAAFDPKPVRVGPPAGAVAAVAGPLAALLPPENSTGRRLALVKWLTDPANPLTARVAVNHVWLRHFGTPLVEDVTDFGLRAARPRHSELLDWLAVELRESGWSMKKFHRLIVTSSAYRMRSEHRDNRAGNAAADPENQFLWRMNARRLEAEAVRDSALFVAGNLDARMGGPEIPLTEGETSPRRGVYFRHAHERQVRFLELFDSPSPLECYRRTVTIVPQQALALLNGSLVIDQARLLCRKLAKETDGARDADGAFLLAAFETVLGRPPTAAESDRCRTFLGEQSARLADPDRLTPLAGAPAGRVPASADARLRARENLVHVLLNHNDFVTVR
jgi:mono/diheme cytochrome c family protein